MTRLAGYQPQYFPRLHYYARVLDADIFKCSDNLQYVRRHAYPAKDGKSVNGPSYQAHTPIKMSSGVYLLDIPTQHIGKREERMLNTVALDYTSEWPERHLRTIEISYAKAPQFKKLFPSLTSLLTFRYENLAACTVATMLWGFAALFELPLTSPTELSTTHLAAAFQEKGARLRRIVRMSEAGMQPADKKGGQDVNNWIIESCRAFDATEYYMGGTASAAYIEHEKLQSAGITLITQDWQCGVYEQQFPKLGFIPNLSILDLLMNTEPEKARQIILT